MTSERTFSGWFHSSLQITKHLANRFSEDERRSAVTMWRLMRPHWRLGLFAFFANLGAAVFEGSAMAIFALALQAVFGNDSLGLSGVLGPVGRVADNLLGGLDPQYMFLILVLIAVGTVVLRSSFQLSSLAASSFLEARVFKDSWRAIFSQIMNISHANASRYRTGDLQQYVGDSGVVYVVFRELNMMIGYTLLMLAYIILMLLLSWQMTLIAIAALLLLSRFVNIIRHRIRISAEAQLPAEVELSNRSLELIAGQRLVRTFAKQKYAINHVGEAVESATLHSRKRSIWSASIDPMMQSVTVVGVAIFLVIGYFLLREDGQTSLAILLTFLFVLYRLLPQAGNLNRGRASLTASFPVVRRVTNILRTDDKEYTINGSYNFEGLQENVEFCKTSLLYIEGERPAVRDLSFTIPRNNMVALVGESGAGKSSVSDLLLRLFDPTDGTILVDGIDLRNLDITQWRNNIGVVNQDTFLFNATVRHNIAFGKLDATDDEIKAAARAAHAAQFIENLEKGYDTVIGDRGYRLSGGQRQRIAIARVILRDPSILIFDEATSDLDSESERLIQGSLDQLRENRTILIIAHRLSTIVHSDNIIVLDNGQLIEQGNHQQLLANNGRYSHFWQLQVKAELRNKTNSKQ